MSESNSFTLAECAKWVSSTFRGDPNYKITQVGDLQSAQAHQLSYLADKKYLAQLKSSQAGVVILPEALSEVWQGNAVFSDNPKWAYAVIAKRLHPLPKTERGIHETAVIHPSATIGEGVSIGPYTIIEAGAIIGKGSVIQAHGFIGQDCKIGEECYFFPRVTLYYGTQMGNGCVVQSGVVIGSEGFGFARHATGWEKVPQLGRVVIGNRVEIGANTTIDRGAIDDTIIENNVILDNLIQIAHNVRIGENTAMAANVGIAGSTTVGKNCMFGGGCNINGHIDICDNVHLVGASGVAKSIRKPGAYGSATTVVEVQTWKRNMFRFAHLDKLAQTVSKLENRLEELEER